MSHTDPSTNTAAKTIPAAVNTIALVFQEPFLFILLMLPAWNASLLPDATVHEVSERDLNNLFIIEHSPLTVRCLHLEDTPCICFMSIFVVPYVLLVFWAG